MYITGSLFTDQTTAWNVAHLPSTLSRLLPSSDQGLPGVNTPYLYFGMWRATFSWHVEDMDLFSINYIHFGAPKFWYAMPQGRAQALEQVMRGRDFATFRSIVLTFLQATFQSIPRSVHNSCATSHSSHRQHCWLILPVDQTSSCNNPVNSLLPSLMGIMLASILVSIVQRA